jgi:hypothetical protein
MSKGKINSWNARTIASKVAEKAFEHILAPMREQARVAAQDAYDAELVACGMTEKIRKALVLRGSPGGNASPRFRHRECTISWGVNEPDASTMLSADKGRYICSEFKVVLPEQVAKLEALRKARSPYEQQMRQMAFDICEQIKDRTVPAVCKAWPEVAPFVYAELRIDPLKSGGPTPVPFSAMVNKHLLALPAPVAA